MLRDMIRVLIVELFINIISLGAVCTPTILTLSVSQVTLVIIIFCQINLCWQTEGTVSRDNFV